MLSLRRGTKRKNREKRGTKQTGENNALEDRTNSDEEENPPAHAEERTTKRIRNDNAADIDGFLGPWAPFAGEQERKEFWRTEQQEVRNDTDRQEKEQRALNQTGMETAQVAETSRFYGKAEYDYQGRSWMVYKQPEREEKDYDRMLAEGETWCFLPKKCIHTFQGHTQGVTAVRLFPKTGHLLLSAGLDCKIKIWDVYNQRQCYRDYTGHDVGLRDIQFTTDGSRVGGGIKCHIPLAVVRNRRRNFTCAKICCVGKDWGGS